MAKQTKSSAKADIPFEDKLWIAANELRGAVAENQYKDYVLSLLFVKHLSERYEARYNELKNLLNDPKSDYYNASPDEQAYTLEDKLEYQVKNVYKLPIEATWPYLLAKANQDDIKVIVDKAFIAIDDILAEREPDHKGLLPPIFVKSQLSAVQVAGLINMFSSDEFSESKHPETDLYGRIYEYYIGKFAMAFGARYRKVTVWSSFISGETMPAAPHKACWANAVKPVRTKNASAKKSRFFILYVIFDFGVTDKALMNNNNRFIGTRGGQ